MGSGGGDNCDPWDVACLAKKAGNDINREASNGLNGINRGLSDINNDINREGSNLSNGVNRTLDETVGELNGRNKEREQAAAQRLIDDAKAESERLRQEELARMRRSDISASRAAGRSQASAFTTDSSSGSSSTSFNNLTRDFLGL